jgi:pyruvate formate lyase activating enzyme
MIEGKTNIKGKIFNIERFGLVDGPGIRTVVFFKGCPLECKWCHNPESQASAPEIMFNEERCIRCGVCEEVCPERAISFEGLDRDKREFLRECCNACGSCVAVCPTEALDLIGYDISVDFLFKQIIRGMAFYQRSGGGVTLSGGEPLMQAEFCRALLQRCRENCIHTAIDTSGCVSWEKITKVLPFVDLFLFDVKHLNNDKHRLATGVSNRLALENLKKLVALKSGAAFSIIIRIPLIPGFNSTKKEILNIFSYLNTLEGIDEVEILPFHQFSVSKYRKLDKVWPYTTSDVFRKDLLKEIREKSNSSRIKISIKDV